jgi:hypothetical protein
MENSLYGWLDYFTENVSQLVLSKREYKQFQASLIKTIKRLPKESRPACYKEKVLRFRNSLDLIRYIKTLPIYPELQRLTYRDIENAKGTWMQACDIPADLRIWTQIIGKHL